MWPVRNVSDLHSSSHVQPQGHRELGRSCRLLISCCLEQLSQRHLNWPWMGYFNTDEVGSWNRRFNADRFHSQGHHQVWAQFFDLLCPDMPTLRISSRPDSDADGASSLVDILSEHLCLKTV